MNPYSQLRVTDYGSVPEKDPQFQMSPLDTRIADALNRRYPGMSEDQLAKALSEEMGLNPYSILYNGQAPPIVSKDSRGNVQHALGGFYQGGGGGKPGGMIEIPAEVKNSDQRKAVMLHELSHAADAVADPTFMTDTDHQFDASNGLPPRHFNRIQSDVNWADTLDAQRLIEQGVPTGRDAPPELAQAIGNNPWLKQVAPMSSNMLANPWRHDIQHGNGVSPAEWNRSYGR